MKRLCKVDNVEDKELASLLSISVKGHELQINIKIEKTVEGPKNKIWYIIVYCTRRINLSKLARTASRHRGSSANSECYCTVIWK